MEKGDAVFFAFAAAMEEYRSATAVAFPNV
jgi:hypothetical protein